MEELNYHPSEVARSLLRKKSNIIGLILPDISHPFFGEVTKHIEAYAYEQGYKLMLCNSLHHKKKRKSTSICCGLAGLTASSWAAIR